jgi:hypothetical protein
MTPAPPLPGLWSLLQLVAVKVITARLLVRQARARAAEPSIGNRETL